MVITLSQYEKFVGMACELSPENISWDGERPARQIAAARRDIMKRWAALEAEVGRKVTESEVWDWEIDKHRKVG